MLDGRVNAERRASADCLPAYSEAERKRLGFVWGGNEVIGKND
jgi:hypothetical protein